MRYWERVYVRRRMVNGREGGYKRDEGKNVHCHYSHWGRDCRVVTSGLWSCRRARKGTRKPNSLWCSRVSGQFLPRVWIEGARTCAKWAAAVKERTIPRHGYGRVNKGCCQTPVWCRRLFCCPIARARVSSSDGTASDRAKSNNGEAEGQVYKARPRMSSRLRK